MSSPISPSQIVTRILTFDRHEMAERGRLGGRRTAQAHDPRERMARARLAFEGRFLDLADPDGTLDPPERVRRAAALRREHFAQLSAQGVAARRARKVAREGGLS